MLKSVKSLPGVAVTMLLMAAAARGTDQPQPTPAPPSAPAAAGPTERQVRRPTLDDQVNILAKRLSLTDAQKIEVKDILERRREKFTKMLGDASISGVDRIRIYRTLQEQSEEQLRAVLTEEQQRKLGTLGPKAPKGSAMNGGTAESSADVAASDNPDPHPP